MLRQGQRERHAKDSDRYRFANFTKAQPLFRYLARLGCGKVISVSVLSGCEHMRLWGHRETLSHSATHSARNAPHQDCDASPGSAGTTVSEKVTVGPPAIAAVLI